MCEVNISARNTTILFPVTSDAQEGLIYLPCVLNVDDNRASGISCNIPLGFGKTKCVQEIQGELSMTINGVPKN